MMEKRGVVEPGRTPPEEEKEASREQFDHPAARAADEVEKRSISGNAETKQE